jgi:GTPase SAR1 family protein
MGSRRERQAVDVDYPLSKAQDKAVKDHAFALVREFRSDGHSRSSSESPLRTRHSLPKSSPLLIRVQNIPDVEADLYRVAEAQLSYHWNRRLSVYIPPQAKASVDAADSDHFPLMEEVKKFLKSERQVLLIRGDSGAGKTTFNHKLAHDLWKDYITGGPRSPIPLFVHLPALKRPDDDILAEKLKSFRFKDAQIKELEQNHEFIVICDGYDERQLAINLHTTNCLNEPGRWKGKLIISCRSQYLKKDYLYNFQPQPSDHPSRTSANLYQEAVIIPFTEDQVEEYVKEFVDLPDHEVMLDDRPKWTASEYMTRLRDIPDLINLVGNPFLLSVSLHVLHLVIGDTQDLSSIRVTGVQLYDIFVDRWMKRGEKRLQERQNLLTFGQQRALQTLSNDYKSFSRHAISYMKNLATSIFEEQAGNPAVEYSQYTDCDTWKARYFSDSAEISILREASPIVGTGTQFQFLHRSRRGQEDR